MSSTSIVLPAEWEYLSSPREPELKVWITTSNGKALPVFKKQTREPANVSAEITGLEGKEFQVHLYDGRDKLTRPFKRTLWLDGTSVSYGLVRKDNDMYAKPKDSANRIKTWSDRRADNGQYRTLAFGKIQTTDDPLKASQSSKCLASAGTIVVKYERIKNLREVNLTARQLREARISQSRTRVTTEQTMIDEASKKAATLLSASGLGAVVGSVSSSIATTESKYNYVDNAPYLTFTFHVRSPLAVQEELFVDEGSGSAIGSSKRGSAELGPDDNEDEDDDDDEGEFDPAEIDAQIQALLDKRDRLCAKKAKTDEKEPKPRVTPPPPFDWQGCPPIDMGKRIYVDYGEGDAADEENREVERDQAKRKALVIEL